jgi:hypothetical protein
VRGSAAPVVGSLRSLGNETWIVELGDGPRYDMTIPAADVRGVEVWRSHRETTRGFFTGAALGLFAGAIVAVTSDADDCSSTPAVVQCDNVDRNRDVAVLIAFPFVGGLAGSLLGSMVESGRWVPGRLAAGSPSPGTGPGAKWVLQAEW